MDSQWNLKFLGTIVPEFMTRIFNHPQIKIFLSDRKSYDIKSKEDMVQKANLIIETVRRVFYAEKKLLEEYIQKEILPSPPSISSKKDKRTVYTIQANNFRKSNYILESNYENALRGFLRQWSIRAVTVFVARLVMKDYENNFKSKIPPSVGLSAMVSVEDFLKYAVTLHDTFKDQKESTVDKYGFWQDIYLPLWTLLITRSQSGYGSMSEEWLFYLAKRFVIHNMDKTSNAIDLIREKESPWGNPERNRYASEHPFFINIGNLLLMMNCNSNREKENVKMYLLATLNTSPSPPELSRQMAHFSSFIRAEFEMYQKMIQLDSREASNMVSSLIAILNNMVLTHSNIYYTAKMSTDATYFVIENCSS